MPGQGASVPVGVGRPGRWRIATVVDTRWETPRARTLRLDVGDLGGGVAFLAGQHVLLRLTAPDGYTAQRSYSIASAPSPAPAPSSPPATAVPGGSRVVELTVERLPGGEVSEFLCDEVRVGDELEVRGPIGRWFVWQGDEPVVCVGGGSGTVPLMAMLRQARAAGRPELVRLLVSARRPEDLYYAGELPGPEVTVVWTREAPPGTTREPGRLRATDLAAVLGGQGDEGRTVFVCGSPPFCDAVTDLLAGLGVPATRVRVERFGPSG
ncbi:FAD-binding oxidoreductase [Pseudonocardia sp. N23]|uniref:FAD-binding oxidoreductase n=1 Tax=Pseudonocardia sp. N23 TaxID=1987376 RepID=UPI000C02E167|nr:FAD-binding oxidoreductase [Pseudonocardia sp. N23]GAY10800.1 flavodoxin reductase family 1 [Pseudonocardia sp. N23]